MSYFYRGNKCQNTRQYDQFSYPASEYPDGYMSPLPESYDEADEERMCLSIESKIAEEKKAIKELGRMPRDISLAIEIINLRTFHEIDEMVQCGMDRKILEYIIGAIARFIDMNYERYKGPIPRKEEMVLLDIKKNLTWAFDIMRIYKISPHLAKRLLDRATRAAIQILWV